jgi:transcriptional regulator with XRE-family HTH domain
MTQREVAEVMGISYQMVQQIERSAMLKLQVALGVVKQTRIPGKGRPRYHYERVETPVAQEMREAVQEHCRK